MLVLSRKINEKIIIGDNIELTIVAVAGDTVRIGIQAPKDIKILRSEVLEDIQKQNLEAASEAKLADKEIAAKLKQMLHSQITQHK
jgi:carbon storage regulator